MFFRSIQRDRCGSVTSLTALALPVSLGIMALDINTSSWEMTQVNLQRIADIAAMAGAVEYAETWNGPTAASTAATVAELNGIPAGTRSGTGTDKVTDDYASWVTSFTVNTSVNVSANTAGTVTAQVQTSAPTWFAGLFNAATTETLSATAIAAVNLSSTGGQACLVALKGDTTAITTYEDISLSGNTSITSQTCGVRSDGSLALSGNATTDVPNVVVSGTIGTSGNAKISCPGASPCSQSGVAQIPDPFYAAYYGDLSIPSGVAAGTHTGNTYNPGVYASLSFSGNGSYILNPGIYYVTYGISLSGNVTLTGNGVTVISVNGNGLTMSGNTSLNLTAPSSGPTAGLVYGSSSTASTSLSGNSTVVLNGAIYVPNSAIGISGNSSAYTTQSSCLAVVALTAGFSGNSNFTNTGCAALGVPALYNKPATAMLIQ
jgi:hypothetical protein